MGARVAEALPSLEVALAIDAIAADEGAVLPICPVPALGFTPVSDPAWVAVGAFAIDVIAGVAILTGGTELLTALSIEARRAGLVTLGAVPACLTRQAAPIGHSAWLQALALPTPPPAALAVEAGWARLAAVLAPVARLAGAGPVHLVALALVALAVAVAARPEGPLPALAAPRELLAG